MTRRLHAASFSFFAVVVMCVIAAHGARPLAQPRTLTGTALQPVEDVESLLGGLIESFGGRGENRPKPTIERVVVTEDAARRLVVSVTYRGLANLQLRGEIRGRDRRRWPQIQSQPVALTDADGQATMTFELQGSIDRDTPLESAFLRLIVMDSNRPMPVVSRMYALPKAWAATPGGATTILNVAPKPIGTTARLGDQPDYAPPPKVMVPVGTVTTPVKTAPPVTGRPGVVVRDHRRMSRVQTADAPDPPAATPEARVAMARQRQQTADKTKAASVLLTPNTRVMQIDRFQYGIKAEDAQKGAQGPAAAPIELLEGLRTEDIALNPSTLFSIATTVYPDKNPASGVFYYHPRAYHLEWTPDGGHAMRILYGAATADGNSGDVLMAARLQSGLDLSELQLATTLMQAYKGRHPATAFTALRPLPLEKDGVDVSLGSVLGQYNIAKEKIAITALSDVLGEIDVSWVTDPVTKENLQLALMQDVGVNGDVAFTVSGGALEPQVPIAIQLADRDSFGRGRWSRTDGYRNATPYPIRLRYLHALVIDPRTRLPILYSWALDNVEVPPQARVKWDAARVPAWIDTAAARAWIDYTVVDTCDACDKQVLDGITGGVTSIAADRITFHTITPLADVGGYEITAYVRSKYFDPKDRSVLQKSVVLAADGQDFVLKPIYNVSRPEGEPLFEYLLELAMKDGTTKKGTRWLPSDGLRVLIGRSQLEQSLGALPTPAGGPTPPGERAVP